MSLSSTCSTSNPAPWRVAKVSGCTHLWERPKEGPGFRPAQLWLLCHSGSKPADARSLVSSLWCGSAFQTNINKVELRCGGSPPTPVLVLTRHNSSVSDWCATVRGALAGENPIPAARCTEHLLSRPPPSAVFIRANPKPITAPSFH